MDPRKLFVASLRTDLHVEHSRGNALLFALFSRVSTSGDRVSALDEVLLGYSRRERELRLEAARQAERNEPLTARKTRHAADRLEHAREWELTDPQPTGLSAAEWRQYP